IGIPVVDRLLDAFHRGFAVPDRYVLASIQLPRVVLDSVRNIGPAVVLPGADDVDLVSALRPMVGDPQLAGRGVDRGAFGITQPVSERLARNRRSSKPRIVLRNRAVTIDAEYTPGEVAANVRVVCEVVLHTVEVRVVETESIGTRDEECAVTRDDD